MTSQPVTVLGLGTMGTALARAFLKAGHPATVWNRTPERARALAAEGASQASTASEAVVASGLVVVCLVDQAAAEQVLRPLGSALEGRTLVNLTSDTPERARAAAEWAAGHGVGYLDGAVMVPVPVIGQPGALVLYSGSREAFTAHGPTLAALGGTPRYLGPDHGTAALYDQAMLSSFYASMAGMAHAFALGRAEKVAAAELVPYLRELAAVLPAVLDGMAGAVDSGRYESGQSSLAVESAGLAHIVEASRARGVDASVPEAVKALADRAIAAGHGGDGFAAVVEVLGG